MEDLQNAQASNDPLTAGTNYDIFIRTYTESGENQFAMKSSNYTAVKTRAGGGRGGVIALIIILCLIVIVLCAIGFVYMRRQKMGKMNRGTDIHLIPGPNGKDSTVSNGGGNVNPGFVEPVEVAVDPINIDELGNHILEKHKNGDRIFQMENAGLLSANKDPAKSVAFHANMDKNRYINIFCYDHSRVKLEQIEDDENSDYINANYIDGYNSPAKFIASQGPKEETENDFWRMMWEQNTATVIMLTRCFEGGKVKCAQYWPEKEPKEYGDFTVYPDSVSECPDYIIRKFRMCKTGDEEGNYHTITQFHFVAWPDHGVPEYPYSVLAFIKRIRQMTPPKPDKGNMVIHCSAGVGRTGTYITIDAMLDRLAEGEKTVDIFNFIQKMREARSTLVQTAVQYIFIHHALHEEHLYGHTEVGLGDLHQYFRRLKIKTHVDENAPIHNEFKTAATLPVKDIKTKEASKEGNKDKNRIRNYLPFDKNRFCLERLVGDEHSTYINASYINGYDRRNMYIASQAPMETTENDFWRMIWESLTSTVVMLTDLEEKGKETCTKFWPEEEPRTFGTLTVELTQENEEDDYTIYDFTMSNTQGVSGRIVRMYRFRAWPEIGAPNCCDSVTELVNVCHAHQRQSEEESTDHSKHPIIVFCHTGVGRTAVWCALAILMERAKAEGVVDVFQTVRSLRQQRQHMVQDAVQYEFLYKALLSHLDSFDQYANFK